MREALARLRSAAAALAAFANRAEAGEATREELDVIIAAVARAERELFGPRQRRPRGTGARRRILEYLQLHVGQPVLGEELAAVSGIQEWARRIRELRVEEGYEITELGDSTYRLEALEPDAEAAALWGLLNSIRRRKGSARERIAALFEARVGDVVTRDQLDYVARIAEGVRRTRELRDEFGWPIQSHIDDPELKPGEYRLLSAHPADRRDPLQRLYPEELRERVFKRDNYTCQVCGRDRVAALAAGDTRFYLEVHHRTAVADDLAAMPKEERNNIDNLIAVCHADHVRETAELQRRKRRERRKG
jgi:biotin operon repressor